MQRGAFAHPEFDAHAPQVDVYCDEEVGGVWMCLCVYVSVSVYIYIYISIPPPTPPHET